MSKQSLFLLLHFLRYLNILFLFLSFSPVSIHRLTFAFCPSFPLIRAEVNAFYSHHCELSHVPFALLLLLLVHCVPLTGEAKKKTKKRNPFYPPCDQRPPHECGP